MEDLTIPVEEVTASVARALEKVRRYLNVEDVEGQFSDIDAGYYSKEKFLVVWSGNYRGIPTEFKVEKCDSVYRLVSGYCCVYGHAGVFHENQIDGFNTFERALIVVGLKLCSTQAIKDEFVNEYVEPYNKKIKARSMG